MEIHKEERPWGNFEQFVQEKSCTVKIITINPNSKLSLQYHNFREEFWRIISGEAIFTLGEEKVHSKKGDELFFPKKEIHCIESKDETVTILEIAFGKFDENDIVRLEDKYGRVDKK